MHFSVIAAAIGGFMGLIGVRIRRMRYYRQRRMFRDQIAQIEKRTGLFFGNVGVKVFVKCPLCHELNPFQDNEQCPDCHYDFGLSSHEREIVMRLPKFYRWLTDGAPKLEALIRNF